MFLELENFLLVSMCFQIQTSTNQATTDNNTTEDTNPETVDTIALSPNSCYSQTITKWKPNHPEGDKQQNPKVDQPITQEKYWFCL